MVKNRARWAVTELTSDGGLIGTGPDGTIELPAEYVDRHVELGYAETVHAGQGRTVDHGILVVDGPIDGPGLYVGMTRGRHTNHVFVASRDGATAREVLDDALSRSWVDRPAHEIQRELEIDDLRRRLDRLQEMPRHAHGLGRTL